MGLFEHARHGDEHHGKDCYHPSDDEEGGCCCRPSLAGVFRPL